MAPWRCIQVNFGGYVMSSSDPTSQKLISIVTKGRIKKTTIFDLIVRGMAIIMPCITPFALIKQAEWKSLISELPFKIYIGVAIVVMVLNIVPYVIDYFKKFTRTSDPIKGLLREICRLFNASIMPDGGARATIYIYREYPKNKMVTEQGCFYRLCDTEDEAAIISRTEKELKCFDAYHNGNEDAIITDLAPEEITKSRRANIKAIFAMPIYNRKNKRVGVLSIDTCKNVAECYALKECKDPNDFELKKGEIGKSLNGICKSLIKHMHWSVK
jgi:hypothetical protein